MFAVLALLLIPLQGFAATLSTLSCFGDDAQASTVHQHSHDDSASSHEGTPRQHDSDTGKEHGGGHTGCHHFSSGLPTVVAVAAPPMLPTFESTIYLLSTLFVPEQPQRPPRA